MNKKWSSLHKLATFCFRKFLDGIAQHGAGHGGGMLLQELYQQVFIALTHLAKHPSDGFLHQVVHRWFRHGVIGREEAFGKGDSIDEIAVSDKCQGRDNGYSPLPKQGAIG